MVVVVAVELALVVVVIVVVVVVINHNDMNGRKEMFYLTMHSTHFIYGYMASDIIYGKGPVR